MAKRKPDNSYKGLARNSRITCRIRKTRQTTRIHKGELPPVNTDQLCLHKRKYNCPLRTEKVNKLLKFLQLVFSFQPFGQLPAFQDGELMLFESRAITRHVLRKYRTSEVNLLREGNLEENALVDVWLDVEAHQYDPTITPIVYQHILVPMNGGIPDQKLIDDSLEKMKKVLDVYEARLSKHKYLAGDFVSLADLSHLPYTVYFMATPFASVLDSYPSVKAWVHDLLSRPAVQRVISQFPKF